MSLTIEIHTEDVAEWLYGIAGMKDAVTSQAMQRVAWFIADTMEEEAPVGKSKEYEVLTPMRLIRIPMLQHIMSRLIKFSAKSTAIMAGTTR